MKKPLLRIISALICAGISFGSVVYMTGCSDDPLVIDMPAFIDDEMPDYENMDIDYGLTDTVKDGAILHAWSWSFNTIKESMAMIAAAGFSSVQTSPINECYVNESGGMELYGDGKWYYHYQPTDWVIGNYQLGTRDEFKAMCDEADKFGIKVIVDVVPNHTTPTISQVSQNLFDAVGGQDNLYHENGMVDIKNWSDRLQCTSFSMGGLPDVNTENPLFQDYFINFINDCIACGADGFRYDTAKHIALSDDPKADSSLENNFWKRLTTEITNADGIFNYGEVLQGDNDRIADYIKEIGAATASDYGKKIRTAVKSGSISADSLGDYGAGGSSDLVTWVESHDNYINDDTYVNSEESVILGWALICARKGTTPLFFDRPYGNTTSNKWGTINLTGTAGSDFYFDRSVVYVNRFRNALVGVDEKLSNPNDDTSVVMIERGNKGAVLVNLSNDDKSINTVSSLPDGQYLDYVNGNLFEVLSGKIQGTVSARSVAVITVSGLLDTEDIQRAYFKDYKRSYDGNVEYAEIVLENVFSAYYSVNGSEFTPCNDGETLVIGNDADENGRTDVTFITYNYSGLKYTMTYPFIGKHKIKVNDVIYYTVPEDWNDTVYAYVYAEEGGKVTENKSWPGEPMQFIGTDDETKDRLYSYTFNEEWSSALVIFTDGDSQIPAAMDPGFTVIAGKKYGAKGE